MKRTVCRFLVVSSLLVSLAADAAVRPRYGRTLHVSLRATPQTLEPVQSLAPLAPQLVPLIFDTLFAPGPSGRAEQRLALAWESDSAARRWQIRLRPDVTFHDGTPLSAEIAAASLRAANPSWEVSSAGDTISIVTDSPSPNLLADLALPRNAIVRRDVGGKVLGTGPFRISDWQPGRKLSLVSNDDYWAARPYLDAIEISLGVSYRDQAIALDLNKADLVEIAPEQIRRATSDGRHVAASAPIDLLALAFARPRNSADEGRLRDALSLSLDRSSMRSAFLQGEADIAGGILPTWMTGYGFVFPSKLDLARAQQAKGSLKQAAPWFLSYAANDPLARLLADRIVLNARDAGLVVQLTSAGDGDIRLVHLPLASLEPHIALRGVAAAIGDPAPAFSGTSLDQLYQAERSLLDTQRIVPLLHLPRANGLGVAVRNWHSLRDGSWSLENVWLATEKP